MIILSLAPLTKLHEDGRDCLYQLVHIALFILPCTVKYVT